MNTYNEQLRSIMDQIVQLHGSENRIRILEKQEAEIRDKILELDEVMRREQADVDKLERFSLTSIIARIAGNKEEKLEKEQMEAYEAAARLETAKQELEYVKNQLNTAKNDRWKLKDLEMEYEQVLIKKKAAIKEQVPELAAEIMDLENAILAQERMQRELKEALSAGNKALSICDDILKQLGEASDLGTFDILGGGIIADVMKHSHLDDAQILVGKLQNQLRCFKTELADVKIQADLQVSVEGFTRFADYFFDGIFADWSVKNRIDQSIDNVGQTRSKIRGVVKKLEDLSRETQKRQQELQIQLNNRVKDYGN